jgi:hypothetical protein
MVGVYAIVKAPDHGWLSASTLGLAALALALLVVFAVWERRIQHPILPGRVLAIGSLLRMSAIRAVVGIGLYTSFFLGTLYFERVRDLGPLTTGAAFLPQTLVVAALSTGITARLVGRFGGYAVLLAGMSASVGGLVLLAIVAQHTAYAPLVLVALVLVGFGVGLSFVPILTMALADVPPSDAGVASGIVNVSMYISSAAGLAVVGAIADERTSALARSGRSPAGALLGGYHLGFALAAGALGLAAAAAAYVLRPARTPAAATTRA